MEYPKTENLWARDPDTKEMDPANGIRVEEVGLVDRWLVTEKIDGMNMRVIWRPYPLSEQSDPNGELLIYGRTDRAQIPGDLMAYMTQTFTHERLVETFGREELDNGPLGDDMRWVMRLPEEVILFGEGYGPGIQQGGHYREDKSFMLFDVVIDGHWCRWDTVAEIAASLGIDTVPVLSKGLMSTAEVETLVMSMSRTYSDSEWRGQLWHRPWLSERPEGVIARTDPYLYDHRGRRVMFKHKVRDVLPYVERMEAQAAAVV